MKSAKKAEYPRLRQGLALALAGAVLGTLMPYPEPDSSAASFPLRPEPEPQVRPPTPTRVRPATTARTPSEVPSVTPASGEPGVCPADMVLVDGQYCTEVKHFCKRWLDDEKLPFARCAEYAPETKCVGERMPLRFCIDRFESADADGLPLNYQSFRLAAQRCKGQNKRLCTESEWNFACEGEEMLPYPYGLTREPKCNQDHEDLYENNPKRRVLKDLRWANDPKTRCVSPFGVYNMVGNLDEPVRRTGAYDPRFNNALKGGWWMAGRNRCRPATTAHDDYYKDIQVGARCCSDTPRTR